MHHIIQSIYTDPQLKLLAKAVGKEQAEDLFSEVIMQLYDQQEKVIEVYNKGYIKLYVARILIWQKNSKYSQFNKKFTMPFSPLDEETFNVAEPENTDNAVLISKISKIIEEDINGKNWYGANIYKMVSREGMRKVSQDTRIPYASVRNTYHSYKNYLIDRAKK